MTPVLNEGDTAQIGMATSELTKETLSITTNCKDLEFACRYLDYWYTEECMFLDSLGIKDDSYTDNGDGTYTITDKLKDQVANGEFPTLSAALSMYTLVTSDFGLYNWAMFDPMYEGMRTLEAYTPWNESKFDLMLPPCMTMTEDETIKYNNLYTSIQTLVQEIRLSLLQELSRWKSTILSYRVCTIMESKNVSAISRRCWIVITQGKKILYIK